jgi:enterochelin esterase-like enzyme
MSATWCGRARLLTSTHLMKSFLFLFLSSLILSACAVQGAQTAPPPAKTQVPLSTPTAAAVAQSKPVATATSVPCRDQTGRSTSFQVDAAGLAHPLQASVHLPPCYDPSGKTRYPVLYLLHGQGFTGDQWERLGAPETLDRLIAAGEIQPMLLILPEEADTSANPFESAFGPALVEDLLPAVDRAYPTCAQRDCRAIGGLSRGASWAVYLAFSYPETFSAVGAHSFPPFNGLAKKFQDLLSAPPPTHVPHLYIDIGVSDRYRSAAAEFEAFLNQAGIPHEWYLNQGQHDEAYWSQHVEEYLRWYAAQLAVIR